MRKYIFLAILFIWSIPVLAQVDTAWVRRYNGPGNYIDLATALAVDGSGNVYVTGLSYDVEIYGDYATIKYAPNGDTIWVRRYNGPTNSQDIPLALAVDDSGNVYVTGSIDENPFLGDSYDYGTVKYAPNGDTLWVRRYNGPTNKGDEARALAVDDSGNVYVTGYSWSGTSFDYVTIKYAPNGDTLWVRRYNGPSNTFDLVIALAVDGSRNVYVMGQSWSSGTSYDYLTIKYAPNGDTLWVRHYNGPGNSNDIARDLAINDSGNVYVTGYSWSGTSDDYATIKYDPDGDTIWVRRYNGPSDGGERFNALALDNAGNVYVTGSSSTGPIDDYATIKYSPNGDTLWVRRYNGPANSGDGATALAVDDSGNVYVTGISYDVGTFDDYATIKYAPNGDSLWVRRYNGPGNNTDQPNALAVDDSGNVYVTGYSIGSGTGVDYATIKYVQIVCLARPGDANASGGNPNLTDIVYLVNYVFKAGPAPSPTCRGDANASGGSANLTDIIYLVNYVFKGGPAPINSNVCCL